MTVLGANNGERLPAIDSQPAFENALRRALEMDEPLQGVLCNNLTVTGENLCRLEALQICLERCRFENCDFSKTSFYDARLVDCDFSNCAFSDSYWKRCQWIGCRLNGANFAGASLHDVQARDTRLRYANFARALMENVKLTDCDCADAGFAEVKLRRTAHFGAAREFVDLRKQERLRATASMFLEEHETALQPRFDVIEIYAPDGLQTRHPYLRQIEDAFYEI